MEPVAHLPILSSRVKGLIYEAILFQGDREISLWLLPLSMLNVLEKK